MLVSGSAAVPARAAQGASQGFSIAGTPANGAAFNHTFSPATGDLLAMMMLSSVGTATGTSVGVQWGTSGPLFSQQRFVGTQGVTKREFAWIGTLRGATVGTAVTPLFTTTTVGAFSDILLWVYDLSGWGGGVGTTGGTQGTASASSVSVAFTPSSGISLLVGAGGAFNNLCSPFTLAGGPTKGFDGTSGTGGSGVAAAGCSFFQKVTNAAAATIQVSSATADSNWALAVAELY